MICLLCGAKVPFFRRLSDPEYCSDAHRSEHERDMAEQALARLTRKPIPAKFAESPKEPEVELRPLIIPPLTVLTEDLQREPGEFGSRTSGFLVRPPAAHSQLWDFLSDADNIAWTAALHIPSFFGARTFTGLRIAGRQGAISALAGNPPGPREASVDPLWRRGASRPLVLRIGPAPQLIGPGFYPKEAGWQKLLRYQAPFEAGVGVRVSAAEPRFGVLLPLIRRATDASRVTAGLAPRARQFLEGVLQPLPLAGALKVDASTLRLGLARVERVKFTALISLPHALPEAGFADLVKPASVAVMRPHTSVPRFRGAPLIHGRGRTFAAGQPRLAVAAFTTLEAACAMIAPARAQVSTGNALLTAPPPVLPSFAATVAQPRRMSVATLESMIPVTSGPPAAVPLNGAAPLAFCWSAAHPPARLSTSVPAMAMVGVVGREKPSPVYAPARPRRSSAVPRPFRVSIRLGEFHVSVLEPGHPSETAPAAYRPAALDPEKPKRRAKVVEREPEPVVKVADRAETDLRRKLAAEAVHLPAVSLLERIRTAWDGVPKLARAAIFAAPALAALLLYVQGTETNVAAGGRAVDVPAQAGPGVGSPSSRPVTVRVSAPPVAAAQVAQPTEPAALPPAPAAEDASGFSLASFRARIRKRSSVYVDEDFREGLLRWNGDDGWDKSWGIDRSYLATPGKLALLEPTLQLENYRFEFLGQIVKKSLSFVYRAKDLDNYYAGRINLITARGSQNGKISVSHWVVLDGEEQDRKEVQIPGTVDLDAMYRVLVLVQRDHFTLHINGQMADYFDDNRLATGGIGFFNEKGAVSKLLWAKVIDNDDFLGTVCSLLSPKTVDRRTLNRDTSGKDSASR